MPVMLTPAEMEAVTGGRWENLPPDLQIEEVEYIFHYLKKGDLYIVRHKKCHKIKAAIKKGVAALLVPYDCSVDSNIPVLRVPKTYRGLRNIALASTEKSRARRILVTGSYGKTGFKNHLYRVIGDQFNTYARSSSANQVMSTYCNLASLKPEHDLLIIEQPVSTKIKTARRAGYVRPDICVITSIGHEHIERFGSVDNIIVNKTQIAKALKPGGKFLIPADDPHYRQLKKALSKYDHFDLLTFGSRSSCNARLLYRRYREFGWDVVARIEDETVAYRVPFPQLHEPSSSLAVLLSVYHLGGDVQKAASKFYTCENFKSSGTLYRVKYRSRNFLLYDQSYRGGIEGYAQFFRSLANIKPEGNGRKILITSAFVDDADGEIALLDIPEFRSLMEKAGIDLLYTVEKFKEHESVVPANVEWKGHFDDPLSLRNEFPEMLREDDLLCIKGIFESRLPKLVAWLKKHPNLQMDILRQHDEMSAKRKALGGLRPLAYSDKERFMKAVESAGKNNWISFFPFLLFWGFSPSREILFEEIDGVVCLYLFRRFGKKTAPTLELLMPPMPLDKGAMQKALHRLELYRNPERATVLWAEEGERDKMQRHLSGFSFRFKNRKADEFLFDPSRYESLEGKQFRHLRQNLRLMETHKHVQVEMYDMRYCDACLALLEKWETVQGEKYGHIEDGSYTRACLKNADRFSDEELFGIVVIADGTLAAFGFAGKIREGVGCLFIGKYDPDIKGAFDFMKLQLLRRMKRYRYVNDSYALNEGMAFSKRMFRPAAMLPQYTIVERSE